VFILTFFFHSSAVLWWWPTKLELYVLGLETLKQKFSDSVNYTNRLQHFRLQITLTKSKIKELCLLGYYMRFKLISCLPYLLAQQMETICPSKYWLPLTRLHSIISQKTELFITITEKLESKSKLFWYSNEFFLDNRLITTAQGHFVCVHGFVLSLSLLVFALW
jgi:hypothetical protein